MKFVRNKKIPVFQTGKEELAPTDIVRLLFESEIFSSKYETNENYYQGKHKILNRAFSDDGKPNNKIVVNYPKYICQVRNGYFSSSPLSIDSENKEFLEMVTDILDKNDFKKVFAELDGYSSIFGHSFLVLYLDEEGEIRMVPQPPQDWIFVRSNDLLQTPKFAIRYYAWWDDVLNEQQYDIELYTKSEIISYEGGPTDLKEVGRRPHYFGGLPVLEFSENNSRKGAFEDAIPLLDAYENILSDTVNTINYFSDCYLVLTGCEADDKDIAEMKRNRVIVLPENSNASFLMKNINETYNKNALKSLQEDIFVISCTPLLSDSSFSSNSSGVAVSYKLFSMEKSTQNKENDFRKGFNEMFIMIKNIMALKGFKYDDDAKIMMTFTRSNPVNSLTEISDSISKLRGTVSNATLLSQLDFVTNVELEKERLRSEKEEDMEFQLKYQTQMFGNANEVKTDSDKARAENEAEEDNNNHGHDYQ